MISFFFLSNGMRKRKEKKLLIECEYFYSPACNTLGRINLNFAGVKALGTNRSSVYKTASREHSRENSIGKYACSRAHPTCTHTHTNLCMCIYAYTHKCRSREQSKVVNVSRRRIYDNASGESIGEIHSISTIAVRATHKRVTWLIDIASRRTSKSSTGLMDGSKIWHCRISARAPVLKYRRQWLSALPGNSVLSCHTWIFNRKRTLHTLNMHRPPAPLSLSLLLRLPLLGHLQDEDRCRRRCHAGTLAILIEYNPPR